MRNRTGWLNHTVRFLFVKRPGLVVKMNTQGKTEEDNSEKIVNLSGVVLLGISMVISGQYTAWSFSLLIGFWEFFGCVLIMGSAYLCLVLCLAEMTAAFPFSGGSYGLARVTLGKYLAYVIGSFECMEYILYAAFSTGAVGQMITIIAETNNNYQPLLYFVIYISIIATHLLPKKMFWYTVALLGMFVLVISIIYCIVVAPIYGNFEEYVSDTVIPSEDNSQFFRYMPFASYFFIGIETLPLASAETIIPSKTIPRALLCTIIIAIVSSIAVLFSCASVSPGVAMLSINYTPLNPGLAILFSISDQHSTVFSLIATYTKVVAFSFAYTRQMNALEKSRLIFYKIPTCFASSLPLLRVVLLGSITGFVYLWIKFKIRLKIGQQYDRYFENATLICAYCSYIGILASYIIFRMRFQSLSKSYRNIFGTYSAMYGIVIFIAALISCLGFQHDNGVSAYIFLVVIAISQGFYWLGGGKNNQIYNSEEQAVLFIAYVITANSLRRKSAKKKRKLKPAPQNGSFSNINHSDDKQLLSTLSSTLEAAAAVAITSVENATEDIESNAVGTATSSAVPKSLNASPVIASNSDIIKSVEKQQHNHNTTAVDVDSHNHQRFVSSVRAFVIDSMRSSAKVLPFPSDATTMSLRAAGNSNRTTNQSVYACDDESRNSDSDGSSSSHQSELERYFAAIPNDFHPTDLNFDAAIIESYNCALEEFNSVREKARERKEQID